MLSTTISELLKKQILGILSLLWAWFCVQSPPNMSPPTVIDKAVVPGAHRIRCWSGNDSRAAVVPLRAGSSIEALVWYAAAGVFTEGNTWWIYWLPLHH